LTGSALDNIVTWTLTFCQKPAMYHIPTLVLIAQAVFSFRVQTERHTYKVTDTTDNPTHYMGNELIYIESGRMDKPGRGHCNNRFYCCMLHSSGATLSRQVGHCQVTMSAR